MNDSTNFSNYVFPPLMVGLAVVIKDAVVDGYALSSPVLLADVGINIVAYYLADVIVQFGVNRMFDSSNGETILQSGSDIVLQPTIHGLICGVTRPMVHSQQTLITHPITFTSSFVDGAVYNIVAKYLSSPLVLYFSLPAASK
jgi:hypothetical protein